MPGGPWGPGGPGGPGGPITVVPGIPGIPGMPGGPCGPGGPGGPWGPLGPGGPVFLPEKYKIADYSLCLLNMAYKGHETTSPGLLNKSSGVKKRKFFKAILYYTLTFPFCARSFSWAEASARQVESKMKQPAHILWSKWVQPGLPYEKSAQDRKEANSFMWIIKTEDSKMGGSWKGLLSWKTPQTNMEPNLLP